MDVGKACLISIAGPSGAGKTTTGFLLADILKQRGHQVVVLDDDMVRRQIVGRILEDQFRPTDFSRQVSQKVIAVMQDQMVHHLHNGRIVVNVSGYWSDQSRHYVETVATRSGFPFFGFWLDAPPAILRGRIAKRQAERAAGVGLCPEQGHASDVSLESLDRHPVGSYGPVAWPILDASPPQAEIVQEILKNL